MIPIHTTSSDANSNNTGSSNTSKRQVQQPTAIGAAGLKDIKNEAKKRLKQCLEEKIKETFKPPESMTKKHKQHRTAATSSNNKKGKQQQRRDSDDEEDDDDDDDDDDDEEEEKESEVSKMLTSASHVVRAILLFKNEVSQCIPPDYDAMKVFVMAFERPLQDAVDHVADGMHELEVVEMLQLVDWLAYFQYQVTSILCHWSVFLSLFFPFFSPLSLS